MNTKVSQGQDTRPRPLLPLDRSVHQFIRLDADDPNWLDVAPLPPHLPAYQAQLPTRR